MPRARKTHNGDISAVAEPTKHTAGYRVRFRHNGVWDAAYRTNKEEADKLFQQLNARASAAAAKLNMAPTWLNQDQVKNAEMAYTTLINGKLVDTADPTTFQVIIKAAEKLVEAMDRREKPVKLSAAYASFMAKQAASSLSESTLRDYRRFLQAFIDSYKKQDPEVRDITSAQCHKFIISHQNAARYKCHGYLVSFFKFCEGKHNPDINPGTPGWVSVSPVNMKKNAFQPRPVVSYTLEEVKTLLSAAKKSGALGYILFRLYSMARYDETLRFQKEGTHFDAHPRIDLMNNRIHFTSEVYKKRSQKEGQGRYIPIGGTFRRWIDYCIKRKIPFAYNRVADEEARKEVKAKWGSNFTNLLRHTAITMQVRVNTQPAMATAKIAGTSTSVIEMNYFNMAISDKDATGFFALSPKTFGWS